jgi:ribosomal-protein-alanine N-acetyltransferase
MSRSEHFYQRNQSSEDPLRRLAECGVCLNQIQPHMDQLQRLCETLQRNRHTLGGLSREVESISERIETGKSTLADAARARMVAEENLCGSLEAAGSSLEYLCEKAKQVADGLLIPREMPRALDEFPGEDWGRDDVLADCKSCLKALRLVCRRLRQRFGDLAAHYSADAHGGTLFSALEDPELREKAQSIACLEVDVRSLGKWLEFVEVQVSGLTGLEVQEAYAADSLERSEEKQRSFQGQVAKLQEQQKDYTLKFRGLIEQVDQLVGDTSKMLKGVLGLLQSDGSLRSESRTMYQLADRLVDKIFNIQVQPDAADALERVSNKFARLRRQWSIVSEIATGIPVLGQWAPKNSKAGGLSPSTENKDAQLVGETRAETRGLQRGDIEGILLIDQRCFPTSSSERSLLLQLEKEKVIVAAADGAVLGFVIYKLGRDQIEITRLAVDPTHQRRGVGSGLLQRVVDELGRRPSHTGVSVVVPEGNLDAQLFLRAKNFWAIETVEDQGYRMVYPKPVD